MAKQSSSTQKKKGVSGGAVAAGAIGIVAVGGGIAYALSQRASAQPPGNGNGGNGNGNGTVPEVVQLDLRAYDFETIGTTDTVVPGVPFTINGGPEGTRQATYTGDVPISWPVTVGETYTVTAGSLAGWDFAEWANGEATTSRVLTPTGTSEIISFNAFYLAEAPAEQTQIFLRAYDSDTVGTTNEVVGGMEFTITGGPEGTRTAVYDAIEPVAFTVTEGELYTVTAGPLAGWEFIEWSNGSTSTSRSLTPSGTVDISWNAYYAQTP